MSSESRQTVLAQPRQQKFCERLCIVDRFVVDNASRAQEMHVKPRHIVPNEDRVAEKRLYLVSYGENRRCVVNVCIRDPCKGLDRARDGPTWVYQPVECFVNVLRVKADSADFDDRVSCRIKAG